MSCNQNLKGPIRQWGRQQAIEMITTPLPVEAGGWHTLRALNKQVPGTFPRRCRNLASGNKSHSISHSLWPKGTNLLLPLVRTGSETGQGHIGCYDPAARHWGRTSLTLSPHHLYSNTDLRTLSTTTLSYKCFLFHPRKEEIYQRNLHCYLTES